MPPGAPATPGAERRLTAADVEAFVPDGPGIYAAWLTDDQALDDLGLTGTSPLVAYVGRTGDLRTRLRSHVPPGAWQSHRRLPFQHLAEMLAARGRILPNWWARSWIPHQPGDKKMWPTPSAPARLSMDQALEWQARHLVWGWARCGLEETRGRESAAIRESEPLLNRSGPAFTRLPPPLRRRGAGPAGQTRWLWQMSWASALWRDWTEPGLWWDEFEIEGETILLERPNSLLFEADDAGYPREGEGLARRRVSVPPFDERGVHEALRRAGRHAPRAVRECFGSGLSPEELLAWWSAHVAGPALAPRWNLEEALAQSLSCDPVESVLPHPASLPSSAARLQKLIALEKGLSFHRH